MLVFELLQVTHAYLENTGETSIGMREARLGVEEVRHDDNDYDDAESSEDRPNLNNL